VPSVSGDELTWPRPVCLQARLRGEANAAHPLKAMRSDDAAEVEDQVLAKHVESGYKVREVLPRVSFTVIWVPAPEAGLGRQGSGIAACSLRQVLPSSLRGAFGARVELCGSH
jgi:hypothetical protein